MRGLRDKYPLKPLVLDSIRDNILLTCSQLPLACKTNGDRADAKETTPRARFALGGAVHHGGRLESRRTATARNHPERASPHPRVRGDSPRTGRRGTRARARPFEHRPGGRSRRFHRGAELDGCDQRLPPRPPPVPGEGARACFGRHDRSGQPGLAADPDRTSAHARRNPRPGAGILPGSRRLDAPPVVRSRSTRYQRHRGRRRTAGRGQLMVPETRRHERCHRVVLWRRRHQHRVGARNHEPGIRMETAAGVLHRKQPLRRVHQRLRGDR